MLMNKLDLKSKIKELLQEDDDYKDKFLKNQYKQVTKDINSISTKLSEDPNNDKLNKVLDQKLNIRREISNQI